MSVEYVSMLELRNHGIDRIFALLVYVIESAEEVSSALAVSGSGREGEWTAGVLYRIRARSVKQARRGR
jgi:hypothetical protein